MEPSKAVPTGTELGFPAQLPPEVAELGQRISKTLLRNEGREDVAAAWIGMRIAQLMHDAQHASTDAERAAAANACDELVLAAWARRGSWPRGWPPSDVTAMAAALDSMASPYPIRSLSSSGAGWAGRLDEVLQALEREQRLWTLVALSGLDPVNLDAWLSAGPMEADEEAALRELSKHAHGSIDALRRLLPSSSRLGRSPTPESNEQVVERAVREIKRLAKTRLKALSELSAHPPAERSDA